MKSRVPEKIPFNEYRITYELNGYFCIFMTFSCHYNRNRKFYFANRLSDTITIKYIEDLPLIKW